KRDRSKDKGNKSKKSRKKRAQVRAPLRRLLPLHQVQSLSLQCWTAASHRLKRAEQAALDATIDPLDRQRDDAIGLRDARKTVLPELHKEEESAAAKAEREEHEREAAEILKLHRDMRRRAEG
ncbi:unnamed protein product, partial [Polarella glacialis]